jgi:3-hydroxybutyryl-CoA dehydrogenase
MDVRTIGVVGCGLMGGGIVEVAAVAGFDVVAVKATTGTIATAALRVDKSLEKAVAKGRLTPEARDAAQARITFTGDFEALERCDLVIESIAESLTSKKRMLADMEKAMRPDAILASNTSSLPLAQLAAVLLRPERFLGLHFFSPVAAMKLVEVAPLATTNGDVTALAIATMERLGKSPTVTRDDPGYVVNRLLVPYLCQAIDMLEQGVARASDIDQAMKLGCGHPMGPLALSDLIGLDVVFAMAQTLNAELRDKRFRAPSLLRRLVLSGQLGKKSGVGLYDYRGETPVENPEVGASVRSLEAVAG